MSGEEEVRRLSVKVTPEVVEQIDELIEENDRYRWKSDVIREGVKAVLRHHGKRQPVRVKPDREVRGKA